MQTFIISLTACIIYEVSVLECNYKYILIFSLEAILRDSAFTNTQLSYKYIIIFWYVYTYSSWVNWFKVINGSNPCLDIFSRVSIKLVLQVYIYQTWILKFQKHWIISFEIILKTICFLREISPLFILFIISSLNTNSLHTYKV